MKPVTAKAATRPNIVSAVVMLPGVPNKASISSSPVAVRAPIASATEKTTPVIASVDMFVLPSMAQIIMAPTSSATSAPISGLSLKTRASPIPGKATCEKASAANVILRITAKHPTNPAATAIAAQTISALASMVVVKVETDWRTVDFR